MKLLGYLLAASMELIVTRPRTIGQRAAWLHRACARILRGFGVELKVEGRFPERGALISNHLGYLDIVTLAAMNPVVFCAKAEMERWPLLGWMARMAGTVFVDRGAGGSSERAEGGMTAAAQAGVPVVFFPEGTTTDGTELLPFHSGLLAVTLAAGEPVTAAYLEYRLDDDPGNGGATAARDVCFWGKRSMLKHIFRFVGLKGVHATVRIAGAPIEFSEEEENDRKLAAVEAREAVLGLQ